MALDVLAVAAASTGIESLFSRAKEVVTDRRTRLDPVVFKQIECLNYHWKDKIVDYVRLNEVIEELEFQEFEYLEREEEMFSDDEGNEEYA